jgi:cobalt-zinc-cadmium resistance protein CzcA
MRAWFEFLLARRWLALALAALAAIAGALAWVRLPIDAFPDVTNVQAMVLARAPGLTAEDVEQRVTVPIEQRMGGLPRVTQVRSTSRAGLSQVVVVFRDGVDAYFARQLVFERLAGAAAELPPGVEPELAPLSTGLGEILQYTVEGDGIPLVERRSAQDWIVAPQLKTLPGVTEVNSLGGAVKQIQVLVRPERLLQYGLTLHDVVAAVERNNANAGAGQITRGWEQYYVRGAGQFRSVDEIGRVVLAARDGTPVFVSDVAEIAIGAVDRLGAVTRDARGETVAGMVIMLRGENSRDVVLRAKRALAALGERLPPGVSLDVFYDRTELIAASVRTVTDALWQGALLVVIVLFLFVADFRTAAIVVLTLPVSFLYAFVLMGWAGLSANLMSLGGLAFSVGMVVDASIVVVENVRRHLAEQPDPARRREAVLDALVEVARPVAFSVLVVALVLAPLLTLEGTEGKMFGPLALALLFALLTSLAVALAVAPLLSDLLLAQRPEREFGFVRRFHQGYLALLRRAMARPVRTFAIATLFLAGAAALVPWLGTEFLPPLDEGSIAINVVRLPNAGLDGSVATGTLLERLLREFPEVQTVVTKTGRSEISEDPMGPEQSDVFVMLKPPREWTTDRTKDELIEAMSARLAAVPGIRSSFSQPIALRVNELVSGVKSDLALKVFGTDLAVMKRFADRAAAELGAVAGARDVKVEQVAGMTHLEVEMDREALARYGLDAAAVNALLEDGVGGRVATHFLEDQRRIGVAVRFPPEARSDERALGALLVPAPGGERVPLAQVARFERREGPAQVSRENAMRRVVVEANVRGRDLGGFVEEVRVRLAPLVSALPPGYHVEYGGQFENQQRAMARLAVVVPIALALIVLLMFAALGSLRDALLVLLALPFALAGGVIPAVALGMHLSVSAAVAFIVLLGIAVQNGVVLIAYVRQLRARGRGVEAAVIEGCDRRFKPLFMTALTSFIGHLPMVFATGPGADIQKPLAVIVMGGIVTSTVLTLLVLPALYELVTRREERNRGQLP